MAQGWVQLSASQRAAVKADYGQAGIKLIVSGWTFFTFRFFETGV